MKKPLGKRLNRQKGSKVTFKTHKTRAHHSIADDMKVDVNGIKEVRPEEVKFHQNYQ